MNDEQERQIALRVLGTAEDYAAHYAKEQDMEAATAAILMRALELATPELSAQQRARLFMEEE